MRAIFLVGRPPAFGHDLAVAHQHEAVDRVDIALHGLYPAKNSIGRDTLGLRKGRFKRPRQAGEQIDKQEQNQNTCQPHGYSFMLFLRHPIITFTRRFINHLHSLIGKQ